MTDDNSSDELQEMAGAMEKIRSMLVQILNHLSSSGDGDYSKSLQELQSKYDILENTLATSLNWVKLQQGILSSVSTIIDWTNPEVVSASGEVDELRYRIRGMILPQFENLQNDLMTSEKSAQHLGAFVMAETQKIPQAIKSASLFNKSFLELLEYNPTYKTSLLGSAISALYRGDMEDFLKSLDRIEKNIENKDE